MARMTELQQRATDAWRRFTYKSKLPAQFIDGPNLFTRSGLHRVYAVPIVGVHFKDPADVESMSDNLATALVPLGGRKGVQIRITTEPIDHCAITQGLSDNSPNHIAESPDGMTFAGPGSLLDMAQARAEQI